MIAYLGRFAPSPTGPLHIGSLIAAVASYCDARARGGRWLVRIEDLDVARTVPGAADRMLATLDALGFTWDGPVLWQSARTAAYEEALDRLRALGRVYPCACSRKEMADSTLNADGERIYPGTCRNGLPEGRTPRSLRLGVGDATIAFNDAIQGPQHQDLARTVGDFILRRADGLFAYQLAVVVDDAAQGVTHVVRGADLLGSTSRQILLQHLLGLPTPAYAHCPVAITATGEKLSKQTLAPAVDAGRGAAELLRALRFLGQPAPEALARGTPADVWAWAHAHWQLADVPQQRAMPV